MAKTPAYMQIAEEIRKKIINGVLGEGERIPSESALCETYQVSTITARRAIAELKSWGLVDGRPGSGVYVLGSGAPVARISPWRHWRDHPDAAWIQEAETAGAAVEVEHRTVQVAADADVAVRLGRDEGDPVTETAYLIRMDGIPVTMSTSWEPAVLTAGTCVADPHAGPHANSGIVPRFDAIGWRTDTLQEDVTTRMPTPAEAAALELPAGVPVFQIDQVFYADLTAVQAARIIIAGSRYRLSYRMEIR